MRNWGVWVFMTALCMAAPSRGAVVDIPVENFDDMQGWGANAWTMPPKDGLKVDRPQIGISSERTHNAKTSLKIQYSYMLDSVRVDNFISHSGEMPGKPTKFSVWLYGDGSGQQLDFVVTDRNGQSFCVSQKLDWKDQWRQLDFDLAGNKSVWGGSGEGEKGKIAYPINRYAFDIVKSAKQPAGSGVIYVADLRVTAVSDPEVAAGLDGAPAATCPQTSQAPQIDGKLDDPAWKEAALITDFRPNPIKTLTDPTQVFLARDERNLYLAFRCFHKAGVAPVAGKRERDLYQGDEDTAEFTIAPRPGMSSGWHVIVNAANSVYDEKQTGAEFDGKANLALLSATGEEKDAWTCEVAIPFDALGVAVPADGEVWNFNFCRSSRKLLADWSGMGFRNVDAGAPVTFVPRSPRVALELPAEFTLGRNELKVSVAPFERGTEPLTATVAYYGEGQKAKTVVVKLEEAAKTIPVEIDRRGPLFFLLEVSDGKNRTLHRSGLIERDIKKILSAEMSEMAYYKTDMKAILNIGIDFANMNKDGKELRVECRNNDKVVDRVATTYLPDNSYSMMYSLDGLPENHYTVDLWLRDGENVIDTATTEFDLVNPAPRALEPIKTVTLDENKYIRVNGKPFLPLALWWTWPQQYNLIKYYGFNTVGVPAVPLGKADALGQLAENVAAGGLYGRYNLWPEGYGQPDLDNPQNYNHLYACFQAVKDHGSNLFYNFGDEVSPEMKSAPKYAELYQKMKQERPERLSTMTTSFHYSSAEKVNAFTNYTDILLPDIYNVGRSPMSTYYTDCKFVEKNLADRKLNTFMLVGQANAYVPGGYRFPDKEEIRLQVYLGLFGGSCGIGWFKWGAENTTSQWSGSTPPNVEPGLRDRARLLGYFKRLNAELESLTPVICSKTIEGKVSASPADKLLTWCKKHEGSVYVFVANVKKEQVAADIQYAGKLKDMDAEVIYEFRKVKVKGGVICDTFKPYEVHIYKAVTEE